MPESRESLNCVLSVTDKYNKRITFVAGKDTYKASDWAQGLLQQLDVTGWGIPRVILSDIDPKFLSSL